MIGSNQAGIAMDDRNLLGTGLIGSAIAALCCGTPLLAIALGSDYVVPPTLLAFLALSVYALYRMRRHRMAAR